MQIRNSIRKFLLINLLLAITLTTTLTAIGNYYLDEKDIQEHLDIIMAVSALSYQALLTNNITQDNLDKVQTALNHIPEDINKYFKAPFLDNQLPEHYLNKFSFQVINKEGQIILHSPTAPEIPITDTKNGFNDRIINDQDWRTFTLINPQNGLHTVLAERYDTRKELGELITEDDLYIMLLTFPLSGILIWLIIGKSLASLERVAQEVSNRAPSHLEPVNIKEVPEEIKPVIDELNQLFLRLQEAFEREKRFAADAAHELRTPLAALKAQAQVALQIKDAEEKNKALEKLISSVNRSAHVVEQLLTLSKLVPESGIMHETTRIDLIQITQDILTMIAPTAIEKQIELSFDHEKNVPKFIGNATAIGILIRNLVDNAIRYTDSHGLIEVNVYKSKDTEESVLEVADNGPGIPDELKSRVFERFFRVLGSKSQGSGLGLGIVSQICSLHGARIELDKPEMGTGLIVRVYFK